MKKLTRCIAEMQEQMNSIPNIEIESGPLKSQIILKSIKNFGLRILECRF